MSAVIKPVWNRIVLAMAFGIAVAGSARAQTAELRGNVPSEAHRSATYGDAPVQQVLSLELWFKPRNQSELEALIAAQQDPKSPQYHKWLTSREYNSRFGPTSEQFDAVSRWLSDQGFEIIGGSLTESSIRFKGSTQTVLRAFNTRIAKFSPDGSSFGNLDEPQVPAQFAPLIGSIVGLDNLRAARAMAPGHLHSPPAPTPRSRHHFSIAPLMPAAIEPSPDAIVDGYGPNLGPSDFYVLYNELPLKLADMTGSGCIAVLGDSDYRTAPISAFNNAFGLPNNVSSIEKILADSTSPGFNSYETETLLDLEWAHAVAPGASIKYFLGNENNSVAGGVIDALHAAVSDGACGVISASFAYCGGSASYFVNTIGNIVTQGAAQGQTILVASGDWGAAGLMVSGSRCVVGDAQNVNEFASNPLITSVGGTSFNSSAFVGGKIVNHPTERVWNDPNDGISGGLATGGGKSIYFSKPAFQNGVTPSDGARDQPDVALIASPSFPGMFFYDDDGHGGAKLQLVGGTSISTPMWAGIINLLDQKSGGRVGPINSHLYQMASANQTLAGFYDVASGNNNFRGVHGFAAGQGYDLVTGWGTVDVTSFVLAYTGDPGAVSAAVKVKPVPYSFGNVKLGKRKTKKIKLINTAAKKGGATITFKGGSISGSPEFSLATTCSGPVRARKKCLATVLFTPTAPGPASAVVTIGSDAFNGPQHQFTVSGIGL